MRKRLSIVLTALCALFISCGGGLSQEGTGSISMDAGRVAKYLGQHANHSAIVYNKKNGNVVEGLDFIPPIKQEMKVGLSTIGSYTTSTEIVYSQNVTDIDSAAEFEEAMEQFYIKCFGKTITLEEIPVGSHIRVKAVLTISELIDEEEFRKKLPSGYTEAEIKELLELAAEAMDTMTYSIEGTSDLFTVHSGSNSVTVRIDLPDGEEEIEVPIMLFSKDEENGYKISTRLNGKVTQIIEDANPERPIDCCFDNDGNIYILYYENTAAMLYSSNPSFGGSAIALEYTAKTYWLDTISYDSVTKQLYGYYGGKITCLKDLITKGSITDEDFVIYSLEDVPSIDKFVVHNNIVYADQRVSSIMNPGTDSEWEDLEHIYFRKFDLNTAEGGIVHMDSSAFENIDLYEDSYLDVKDMYYLDDAIYVLVITQNSDPSIECGELIRIDLDSESYTPIIESPVKNLIVATGSNGDMTSTIRQPDSINSKAGFFRPTKIIGVKPKELIIADDGVFVYADNTKHGKYKNVNRIVTVDLDTYKILNVELSNETFSEENSGSLSANTTPFVNAFTLDE